MKRQTLQFGPWTIYEYARTTHGLIAQTKLFGFVIYRRLLWWDWLS